MTPRKASLQVAHQKDCRHATRTALNSVRGCSCSPSFYVFHRDEDGRPVKGARLKDRAVADTALRRVQVELDENRAGVRREQNITFDEWADRYEAIIEGRIADGDLHPRTLTSYRSTLDRARKVFGSLHLREIGAPELRDFSEAPGENLKPASRIRYLRELSACFSAALDEDKGWLETNPVRLFLKKSKLKRPKRGKAPFEDNELERLWVELGKTEPVYLYAARFSVETGARLGELIALDWPNVDLLNGRVYLEFQHNDTDGLLDAKDREARWVYLTHEARAVLAEWVTVTGARDDGPVFPHPDGGRLRRRLLQRRFAAAIADAGIPKLHPELRLPRAFHSLRYTTSVLMQRRGYHPRLIEATLGHGSLELTYGVYGGWTPAQLAAEAARDPAA